MSAQNSHLPGFIVVSKGVGAALMRIAILFHQLDSDLHCFSGCMSAFGSDAANTVTHTAVIDLFIFLDGVTAVIRRNQHTGFIEKAV